MGTRIRMGTQGGKGTVGEKERHGGRDIEGKGSKQAEEEGQNILRNVRKGT